MKFKIPHIKIKYNRPLLKKISIPLGLGFIMLYVFLVLSNLDIPISSENQAMKWINKLSTNDSDINNPLPEDLLLINIGYDRALVDIYDADGLPMGNIDITDRKKLIDFLDIAKSVGDYKFIVMDIRFTDEVETDVDDNLWKALSSTHRLILPSHYGMNIADKSLEHLTANADYAITILENDFVKYPIATDGKLSMAWFAYNSQEHSPVCNFAGLSFSEGHVMRRSMIPTIDILANNIYDNTGEKKIYNLGEDILSDKDNMKNILYDKFIFIGDFTNQDIHSSYRGIIHGPILHVNVLYDMLKKEHLIGWWTLIILWLLFSGSFALVLYQPGFIKKIRKPSILTKHIKKTNYRRLISNTYQILISFIGFGLLYSISFFLIYEMTNQIFEILVFGTFFTILSSIFNIKTN